MPGGNRNKPLAGPEGQVLPGLHFILPYLPPSGYSQSSGRRYGRLSAPLPQGIIRRGSRLSLTRDFLCGMIAVSVRRKSATFFQRRHRRSAHQREAARHNSRLIFKKQNIRQHRTMGTAGFGGSFAPIVQYEKREIHPVFPHFPYFRLCQNTARISLPHYAVLP